MRAAEAMERARLVEAWNLGGTDVVRRFRLSLLGIALLVIGAVAWGLVGVRIRSASPIAASVLRASSLAPGRELILLPCWGVLCRVDIGVLLVGPRAAGRRVDRCPSSVGALCRAAV